MYTIFLIDNKWIFFDIFDIIISVELSNVATRLILKSSPDTIVIDFSIRKSIVTDFIIIYSVKCAIT